MPPVEAYGVDSQQPFHSRNQFDWDSREAARTARSIGVQ
jgi:hypothetical protein